MTVHVAWSAPVPVHGPALSVVWGQGEVSVAAALVGLAAKLKQVCTQGSLSPVSLLRGHLPLMSIFPYLMLRCALAGSGVGRCVCPGGSHAFT